MRALLSCKDVGSGRAHLARILNALTSQPAPASSEAGLKPQVREIGETLSAYSVMADHFGLERAPPSPDADKLKVAVEALEKIADEAPYRSGYCQSDVEYGPKLSDIEMQTVARQALAALNEQPQ